MDFKNLYKVRKSFPFILSLVLHLIVLVIFGFIRFGDFLIIIPEYATISFFESLEKKQTKIIEKKGIQVIKDKQQIRKKSPVENIITENNKKQEIRFFTDTISVKKDSTQTLFTDVDSSQQYLKLAQSLLDTFLVRNPEYAKLILQEQAKGLAKKKFAREVIVKRLNEALHKYIRENYPEGSRHAINQYTGPGIQIPIDKLINLVLKIFD